jgi:hypothetical protein
VPGQPPFDRELRPGKPTGGAVAWFRATAEQKARPPQQRASSQERGRPTTGRAAMTAGPASRGYGGNRPGMARSFLFAWRRVRQRRALLACS